MDGLKKLLDLEKSSVQSLKETKIHGTQTSSLAIVGAPAAARLHVSYHLNSKARRKLCGTPKYQWHLRLTNMADRKQAAYSENPIKTVLWGLMWLYGNTDGLTTTTGVSSSWSHLKESSSAKSSSLRHFKAIRQTQAEKSKPARRSPFKPSENAQLFGFQKIIPIDRQTIAWVEEGRYLLVFNIFALC